MPSLPAQLRFSLSTRPVLVLTGAVALGSLIFCCSALPQSRPDTPGAPESDVSNIPKPITDTFDRVQRRDAANSTGDQGTKTAETDVTCLLPPLTLMSAATVAVGQLQTATKARSEYQQGCAALAKQKTAEAEKHLRRAVQDYPKYATAWVTLGQLLATQQRADEARDACFHASTADPSYVPAYLCLSDIAARARAWNEVLKASERAIELDSANAIAYEYHAAANLNLHNLAAAEKSGRRAVELDRENREPRTHFVLAQIYEAERDSANEAVQLREYLKYCDSATDAAMVKQYLANLGLQTSSIGSVDSPAEKAGVVGSILSATRDWGPPDVDAKIPPVLSNGACPLSQILKETSTRTLDLIENMERFSASERIEQIEIDKNGKKRNSPTETVNYVAQVEHKSSGYPSMREYRSQASGIRQNLLVDFGAAAFALIFHPTHLQNFEFRCEGLTEVQGLHAWQVHFEESADPDRSFSAISIGRSLHLIRLKGRAWIATNSSNVLCIETDLAAPIAQIDLQREHQIITYAPVEFPGRHIRLWLPESSSLYIAYRGHRYERVHTFSRFQLFSVDSTEVAKDPPLKKVFEPLF